jgi:FKBP-type peptidyl-prolyl cis-trans isomerase FklB
MISRSFFRLSLVATGLLGTSLAALAQQPAASPPAAATPPAAAAPATPFYKTERERIGYAIGANVGKGMKEQGVDADPAALAAAVTDAMNGSPLKMTDSEMQATLTALQEGIQKRQMEKTKVAGDANKKEGDAFLAANKTKDGVKTTASGLQYKVVKEGTGASPKATDTVSVNYRGTLVPKAGEKEGKEFDSSLKGNAGKPVSFPVNRVIPGWTEAVQLMKVGSKYQLFIPANLAYGERGAGTDIGPNSTLIFDVELVGIEAPK